MKQRYIDNTSTACTNISKSIKKKNVSPKSYTSHKPQSELMQIDNDIINIDNHAESNEYTLNNYIHKCCFCGYACNPNSQCCGACARGLW